VSALGPCRAGPRGATTWRTKRGPRTIRQLVPPNELGETLGGQTDSSRGAARESDRHRDGTQSACDVTADVPSFGNRRWSDCERLTRQIYGVRVVEPPGSLHSEPSCPNNASSVTLRGRSRETATKRDGVSCGWIRHHFVRCRRFQSISCPQPDDGFGRSRSSLMPYSPGPQLRVQNTNDLARLPS
jgi:hypothetical protein